VTRSLAVLACVGLALAGALTHFSSAAFTNATAVPSNALAIDKLSNYFAVVPAGAVQPGTSTSIASGDVDTLALAFGTIPSARTIGSIFRITNVSGSSQTATLTLSGAPQISSAVFASSGSTTAMLPAGGSTTLTVTTSSTVAGHGAGSLQLGLSGLGWMYRTYGITIDEAPEVSGAPTATAAAAGRINLSWAASSTTTNLAGYNLYRSSGAGFTKLNATPLTATTYADTATVDGTSYTYKVRAVSSGTPTLESLDSATATATADATPPGQPTAISLANGGGNGTYINAGNAGSLSVDVSLPSGSLASDQVTLTLTSGASTVVRTASATAGAGTVTFSSLSVSSFGDGAVSISAWSTDAAGNASTTTSSAFTKDTAAPAAPSGCSYTDNVNTAADVIACSTEANASISITGTGTYSGSANGAGAFSINVSPVHGTNGHPVPYSYSLTATDAAGNTSGATTVAGSDTK
jgi:large repetitive protein